MCRPESRKLQAEGAGSMRTGGREGERGLKQESAWLGACLALVLRVGAYEKGVPFWSEQLCSTVYQMGMLETDGRREEVTEFSV